MSYYLHISRTIKDDQLVH